MSVSGGGNLYEYPNGVLRNKHGIMDAVRLQQIEATAVSFRLLELSVHPLPGYFDLNHLKAIHRHLFQDIYDSRSPGCRRVVICSLATSASSGLNL